MRYLEDFQFWKNDFKCVCKNRDIVIIESPYIPYYPYHIFCAICKFSWYYLDLEHMAIDELFLGVLRHHHKEWKDYYSVIQ